MSKHSINNFKRTTSVKNLKDKVDSEKIREIIKPIFFGQASLSEFYEYLQIYNRCQMKGLKRFVKARMQSNEPINNVDKEGWNCLHRAVICDFLPVVQVLVEEVHADVNIPINDPDPDRSKHKPLDLAIIYGKNAKESLISYLLDKGATSNEYSTLHAAVMWGTAENLQNLLKNDPEISNKDSQILIELIRRNDIQDRTKKLCLITNTSIKNWLPQRVTQYRRDMNSR